MPEVVFAYNTLLGQLYQSVRPGNPESHIREPQGPHDYVYEFGYEYGSRCSLLKLYHGAVGGRLLFLVTLFLERNAISPWMFYPGLPWKNKQPPPDVANRV